MPETLAALGWTGLILLAWIGLSVGSFLNVVIYRLPVMMQRDWRTQAREILELEAAPEGERFNLSVPRSRCPHCNHAIRWYENIPVLSWIALRARCSNCGAKISPRYPAIELLTGALTLVTLAHFGFGILGIAAVVTTWLLIALTFIDYDTQYLPDPLVYLVLWLGLAVNGLTGAIVTPTDAIIGAACGYLFLWLTYWAFKLTTGKEGMGYGDFKLLAALGAWVGWQALPAVILISAVVGLLYAVSRMLLKRQSREDPIPFGPFLAVAGYLVLLYRDSVLALMY